MSNDLSLIEQIDADLKTAMRTKDEVTKLTLRSVKASLTLASKEGGQQHDLTGDETLAVLQREAKRRRDAATEYRDAGRPDRAEQEMAELAVLERYLPQQLSDPEIQTLAEAVIDQISAASTADMGKVMSAIMPRIGGRADGKRVNQIVRNLLAS